MGDTEFRRNVEMLKQAVKDAKRLKKEIAVRIEELDARLKKLKTDRERVKKAPGQ